MELQEIFDKMVSHLRQQGKKSMRGGNLLGCAYRSEDGAKCAVGCLIPDDMYDPKMEGLNAGALLKNYPKFRELLGLSTVPDWDDPTHQLLVKMQDVHDIEWENQWEEHFEMAAQRFGLTLQPA